MKTNSCATNPTLCLTAALLLFGGGPVAAQIKLSEEDSLVRYGNAQVVKYQVGVRVTAKAGPVQKIMGMMPVPLPCAEQDVQILEEDFSPAIGAVEYRGVDGGEARLMYVGIPYLGGGAQAHALVTFEVRTHTILPPDEEVTATLVIPDRPGRQLVRYLGRSPYIETNHSKIRRTLRDILTAAEESEASSEESSAKPLTDWQRVEAIYNFVYDHVEYLEGHDKSAIQTLDDAQGDCQNIGALFVALCRTAEVPARLVWVHNHQYAEFCLEDEEGKPHWFPCETSGTKAFGEMPLARVILQKGDNFKVPERPRERLRYANDYLIGVPVRGSGKPSVRYIREPL